MKNPVRIQLDITAEDAKEIQTAMDELAIVTRKDFYELAVETLLLAMAERKKGNRLVSIDAKGEKSNVMIFAIEKWARRKFKRSV